ncbi:MAG: MFS transporter [Frankia sp.]|nr:MFS transporter [Frankia sp.]
MRRWLPLVAVCLGTFMLLIDVTVVNVALPDMVVDLDASFQALQWVVDAYALALAALVLGAGSVADLIGHRRTYLAGLALFAVSSLACGLAPSPALLIAARTVQGVGAAAMFATNFPLLNATYTGRDRGVAYGMWGAIAGAASAVGPILGGLLTEYASWRWIFFVNLPVTAAAVGLCLTTLPGVPARRGRVDVRGIVTFTAAAAALTYALIRANEHGWSDTAVWSLLVASAGLLVAFLVLEARSPHAMFDLALLRNRRFVGVLLAGMLLTFAAFAAYTYISIWLQSVLGLSPLRAGLVGLPMSITAFLVSALIGRLLHDRRPDLAIAGGLLFIGLGGLVSAALVHGSATWTALLPGFAVVGIGVGLATATLGSVSMSLVPPQRTGMASGAVNTTRQLGFALGIAVLGSVFVAGVRDRLTESSLPGSGELAHAVAGAQTQSLLASAPSEAARSALDTATRAAAVTGVRWTVLVAGLVGVVAAVLVAVLMRPQKPAVAAPASVPGDRPAVQSRT